MDKLEPLKQLYQPSNQQSVQEVIATHRKLTSSGQSAQQFINKVFQSTLQELSKNNDVQIKVVAAEKLLFLINQQVDGVDQAAFNIIELMGCSTDYKVKHISYLIAPFLLQSSSSSNNSEDHQSLLLLTTNIFIKDFSNLHGECAIPNLALNCLSQLCDEELAQMIFRELFPLFTCSNA